MIRCRRSRRQIELYVGGDLDGRSAAQLQLHLQSCSRCSAALRSLERSQRALCSAAEEATPTWSPLWPQLREICSQDRVRQSAVYGWIPSAGLAAACVLILLAAWCVPSSPIRSTTANVAAERTNAGPAELPARDREFLLPEAQLVSGSDKEQF